MSAAPVIVVGAGLAGLAAAHRLREAGRRVIVVERESWAGGVVRTERVSGFLVERGPQTFLDEAGSPVRRLAAAVGIEAAIQTPLPAARIRFVVRGGRPRRVPQDLRHVLSVPGIVRVLREAFVPRRRLRDRGWESVAAFARRRFGHEAADRLFDPLVTGIFAGDPERLDIDAALPRLGALERAHGSVLRAVLAGGLPRRQPATFAGGMGALPEALAARLGEGLRLRTRCAAIALGERGIRVLLVSALDGTTEAIDAAAAIVTAPAPAAAELIEPLGVAGREIAEHLRAIPWAPVAGVALGFDEEAFAAGPPRGFGLLVPRREGLRLLGCLFPSACFAGAAPAGQVLLRVLLGGRRDPEAVDLDDDAVVALCRRELGPLLGLRAGAPLRLARVIRHRPGIPQYERGQRARAQAIERLAARLPGLALAGSSFGGVATGEVIAGGEAAAERALGTTRYTASSAT